MLFLLLLFKRIYINTILNQISKSSITLLFDHPFTSSDWFNNIYFFVGFELILDKEIVRKCTFLYLQLG